MIECCAVLLLGGSFLWKEKLETVVECLPMSTSKSSGRIVDKLDLRTWFLNLRMWTLGFSFEVFETTCIDTEERLREATFSSREYRSFLKMFNALCLLLNSRSLLEYVFIKYYLCR